MRVTGLSVSTRWKVIRPQTFRTRFTIPMAVPSFRTVEVLLSLMDDHLGPFAVSLEAHGPLGEIHFRFQDRLNAVYGKNGAGKTWLIRSTHHALSGLRGHYSTWVHYRFDEDSLTDENPYTDAIQYAMLQGLRSASYDPWLDEDPSSSSEDPPAPLIEAVGRVLSSQRDLNKNTPFFRELVNSPTFALQPRGHDQPRWRVYAAVAPSSDTPSLNALLDYWKYEQLRDQEIEDFKRRFQDLQDSGSSEEAQEERDKYLERLIEGSNAGRILRSCYHDLGVPEDTWEDLKELLTALPGLVEENLPIPLVPLCDLVLAHGFSILVGENDPGLEDRTLNALEVSVPSIVEAMNDSEVYLTSDARQQMEKLSGTASHYLGTVLGAGAPVLRCAIPGWRSRESLVWQASTDDGATWFRFDDLGSGQRRWATIATQLAILDYEIENFEARDEAWYPYWQTCIFIDEPEAGLHPAAQRAAFDGLARFPHHLTILAATHSAAPFARRDITLWYLHESFDGLSVLSTADARVGELLAGSSSATSELGLDRGGALQSVATFLLVEGEHDEVVVRELIGEQLDQLHVTCLAIRGTKALGSASVEMFLQFTDAMVCFALDNDQRDLAASCWNNALTELRNGNKSGARYALDALTKYGTEEQIFLKGVCLQAIKMGYHERLRVTGWSVPDVISLLPVEKFLPGYHRWGEVEKAREHGENIKDTVKRLRGSPVNTDEVRRIARGLDNVPTDITHLLGFLRDL